MCRELKGKKDFKYHKKNFMAMGIKIDGLLEIAPSLKGSDSFDWENKEMVKFSSEEKMKILNFIQKNERKFTDGDKLEPLPHMESSRPKTIYINTQIYKGKHQLKIAVQPTKESGRKQLSMALDWYQVIGYKMWLEESLRQDIKGRLEDTIDAYVCIDGIEDTKAVRRLPKELREGDLYKWDDVLIVVCDGRMYDSYNCIWSYKFKLRDTIEGSEEVENEKIKEIILSSKEYIFKKNKIYPELIKKCLEHYGRKTIRHLEANEANEVVKRIEKEIMKVA